MIAQTGSLHEVPREWVVPAQRGWGEVQQNPTYITVPRAVAQPRPSPVSAYTQLMRTPAELQAPPSV